MVRYEKNGAIATIRFDRVEKKNAITLAMYDAMVSGLEDAEKDESIRVVAVVGGDSIFTAGNDIGDFISAGAPNEKHPAVKFLYAVKDFPKPIIAGVRGAAIGIGTTLLMHCDAVVAGASSKFSMPFTKLALVPEAASSVLFPLIAGRMRASWYILSGESFGATAAKEMGLASHVVTDDEVEATLHAMCQHVADLPPNSVMNTKRLLKARFKNLVDAAMHEELVAFGAALQSDEARAAFMKFMTRS
jgi:enoyl-CoA hydratase/carnithine racemase